MADEGCEYVGCPRSGDVVDLPGVTSVRLCPRHRVGMLDAVAARLPVEIVAQGPTRRQLRVKRQADWTREDWELRYFQLEGDGHRIEALNAWFRPRRGDLPPEQLHCSCGWRGDYLQWPAHALASAPGAGGGASGGLH